MAIGASLLSRVSRSTTVSLSILLGFIALHASADDQIELKAGTLVTGQITGVSGGQVSITEGTVHTVIYLTDIKSVVMAPPAALEQVKTAAPATVVSTLSPLVQQYAGLPADWVLDAMGNLADAYDAEGQPDKSAAIYTQINQLYPTSPYKKEAIVGQAKIDLKAGKIDVALAALKPLVDEANQNIAPSPADGRLFAGAFLVYGQALEAQKQYPGALEAYLTVKTMFYQNPALVAQADSQAQALLAHHPGVGVD